MTFPTNYRWERLEELPQPERSRHLYFRGATPSGGADGVMVRVEPRSSEPWIGTFAFGMLSPHGVTHVISMPSPSQLGVVARGQGYVVPVETPEQCEEVECHPIVDVRIVARHRIVVFANFTELLCYDETGVRWRTQRLAWDGLTITEVTDDEIRGEFWDLRSEQTSSFAVDLLTGEHQGGAEFT
jgi:hypothetical protein